MQTVQLEDLVKEAPEPHRDQAQRIFDKVFDALFWTKVQDGEVDGVSSLTQWRHRGLTDIETDLAYLEIRRADLLAAFSDYLSVPEMSSKQADWLFLNVLTYAQYLSTIADIRQRSMGLEKYLQSIHPPRQEHNPDVRPFAKKAWHIPVLLSINAISWLIHPAFGLVTTAVSLGVIRRRNKALTKLNLTLAGMLKTYASFNTVDLSWSQVAKQLNASSAVWDASLHALAERRLLTPN